MAKLRKSKVQSKGLPDYTFFCPGCGCEHGIFTEKHNSLNAIWSFNGDINRPTFSPSILVKWTRTLDGVTDFVCHSFVKDGMIQYLGDCTHHMAGQTVELPEIDG